MPASSLWFGARTHHKRPRLSRLARSGCNHSLVRQIATVRDALDRRVERAVYGEKAGSLTDSQRKAISAVRTGRLDQLRLLELVRKSDNGTVTHPLKSFSGMGRAEAQLAIADCFERLLQIVGVATPTLAPAATLFLIELKRQVNKAIKDEVKMDTIGSWLASVWRLVSQPRRQYSYGSGGSSLATFDLQFLKDRSEEKIELEDAAQEERAKRAAGSVGSTPKRDRDVESSGGDRAPNPNSKRQKAKAAKAEKSAKASAAAVAGGGQAEHGQGVVPGPRKKTPAAEFAKDDKKRKEAWGQFNTDHPSKNGVAACWDYWHPQGCSLGAQCTRHHE